MGQLASNFFISFDVFSTGRSWNLFQTWPPWVQHHKNSWLKSLSMQAMLSCYGNSYTRNREGQIQEREQQKEESLQKVGKVEDLLREKVIRGDVGLNKQFTSYAPMYFIGVWRGESSLLFVVVVHDCVMLYSWMKTAAILMHEGWVIVFLDLAQSFGTICTSYHCCMFMAL